MPPALGQTLHPPYTQALPPTAAPTFTDQGLVCALFGPFQRPHRNASALEARARTCISAYHSAWRYAGALLLFCISELFSEMTHGS